jgi:hypothetical protein
LDKTGCSETAVKWTQINKSSCHTSFKRFQTSRGV